MRKVFYLLASVLICSLAANGQMPGPNIGDLGSVTFTYRGAQVTYTTVRAGDSSVWLQQNLGSNQVATAVNDVESYGDLFQWGRWDDGHQLRTSSGKQANMINPNNPLGLGTGDTNFIWNNVNPMWWSELDGALKSDTWSADPPSATNGKDPCTAIGLGWRLPDSLMWAKVRVAENITTTTASGFNNRLKLPAAGYRNGAGVRNIQGVGNSNLYMINQNFSERFPWYIFNSNFSSIWTRGYAGSCRCIYIPLCDGTPIGGKVHTTKQSVCNGDGFTLSVVGATELTNITYQWQQRPVGAATFTDIIEATKTFFNVSNYQQTTEFRCKVTCISTMDSSFSDTLAVAILSLPINLGNDTTICEGTTLTLDAGVGGTEYEWSNGTNSRTITVSDEDVYWAKISNSEGCIGEDTIRVSLLGKPSATAINATAYDLTYAFSVADAQDAEYYEWQFGDGNTADVAAPVHTYQAPGNYDVSVVLGNRCDNITVTRSITVTEPPKTDIGSSSLGESDIRMYPVPTKDLLNITASANISKVDISVFDIDGKEKLQSSLNANGSIQIPVSDWASGIYIIRVVSDKGVEIRKIVRE